MISGETYIAPVSEIVDLWIETVMDSGPEFNGMKPEEDW